MREPKRGCINYCRTNLRRIFEINNKPHLSHSCFHLKADETMPLVWIDYGEVERKIDRSSNLEICYSCSMTSERDFLPVSIKKKWDFVEFMNQGIEKQKLAVRGCKFASNVESFFFSRFFTLIARILKFESFSATKFSGYVRAICCCIIESIKFSKFVHRFVLFDVLITIFPYSVQNPFTLLISVSCQTKSQARENFI